ncbi:MAG TPA: murein biosynthesis integral membrane protein MurJ [Candidatus Acidoferrales bacterium]|nr:murein biosynthesis integral membrane protein MurJ [Candidatus Acidoferrales bacterium]
MAQDHALAAHHSRVSTVASSRTRLGASKRHAFLVASGIFLSRIAGLIRERVFAHYFGSSEAADAFKAAFKIPNFLQTLFGEGVLSASFIPVYAALLAQDDEEEARRTAGIVAALLALVTSILVLIGVLLTPYFIDLIAPGFHGEKRQLTIHLVRILFPGTGLLVFSAWCLGVLNSHRRFFLSYVAPVIWNAAIIGAMLGFGGRYAQYPLAAIVAWGAVIGSALQVGVQLPAVLRLLHGLRLSLNYHTQNVQTVIRNFIPVFVGRGVVQISAYVDAVLASLLPTGAVAFLAYAQVLYTLPVSLFGMSVSAAELPLMSGEIGDETKVAQALCARLNSGLRQIAFFVLPSAVAFLILGDVIVAAIYQTGQFTAADVIYVWGILAGATVGLLASTLGRLYSSTYYALRDTRTPLRYAVVRVILTTILGILCAFPLPRLLGVDARWGVAGLTVSAGISSWVEFMLLRRTLNRRIGRTGLAPRYLASLWGAAGVAAVAGWTVRHFASRHPTPYYPHISLAALTLAAYGILYFLAAWIFGVPESRSLLRQISARARR